MKEVVLFFCFFGDDIYPVQPLFCPCDVGWCVVAVPKDSGNIERIAEHKGLGLELVSYE